jgi:hypothetical protein
MPQPATELHGSYGRLDAVADAVAVAVFVEVAVLVAVDDAVPV